MRHFAMLTTAMALGLGLTLAVAAAPAAAKPKCDDPPCGGGGGGGDSIVYTAELTAGAFVFGPVDVTPNSRESVLRSEDDVTLDIAESPESGTWDQVFNDCPGLLEPNSVEDFFVGDDNWTIEKAGGVRVILRDILLAGTESDVEVTVQLIGDQFDFDGSTSGENQPFLPAQGETSTFTLDSFRIFGRSVRGTSPRKSCHPEGGGGILELDEGSTLVITAVEEAP